METQDLDVLNLKKDVEQSSDTKKDLGILNLKEQKENESYGNLNGTGVTPLRIISFILIALGVVLCFGGIVLIASASDYHPEKGYIGLVCIYIAISCFVVSPIYLVLATIGEAAKIYKDKNA